MDVARSVVMAAVMRVVGDSRQAVLPPPPVLDLSADLQAYLSALHTKMHSAVAVDWRQVVGCRMEDRASMAAWLFLMLARCGAPDVVGHRALAIFDLFVSRGGLEPAVAADIPGAPLGWVRDVAEDGQLGFRHVQNGTWQQFRPLSKWAAFVTAATIAYKTDSQEIPMSPCDFAMFLTEGGNPLEWEEICEWECIVLTKIDFDIDPPTLVDFLNSHFQMLGVWKRPSESASKLYFMAMMFCDAAACNPFLLHRYSYALVACAALWNAAQFHFPEFVPGCASMVQQLTPCAGCGGAKALQIAGECRHYLLMTAAQSATCRELSQFLGPKYLAPARAGVWVSLEAIAHQALQPRA